MTIPTLASLDFFPFIDENGAIAAEFSQKIGIYGIFDSEKTLQYVGYSRDVKKSLLQHLVRCPDQCQWLKIYPGDRPSRTLLEEIKTAWLAENGTVPPGNGDAETRWTQPISVEPTLTPEAQAELAAADELQKAQLLKNHARHREAEILQALEQRGLTEPIRFQPKLKEQGLLDLK